MLSFLICRPKYLLCFGLVTLIISSTCDRFPCCWGMTTTTSFRRGLVPTPLGLVHYTAVGNPDANNNAELPLVAFHMSPRSVDEYKEIMEYCSLSSDNSRLFVAVDEFGYGSSDNPCKSCALDEIADCFLAVMDSLQIRKCVVAGNLMGCYFTLSLASRYPDRIAGVVCSNLYYFPKEARDKALRDEAQAREKQQKDGDPTPTPDPWELQDDGSHISEIWGKRASFLSPPLNTRATLDNLNYLVKRRERYAKGITIQDGAAFGLQTACENVKCPVLCINGAAAVAFFDMIQMNMSGQFQEAIGFFRETPETVVIEPPGSSINFLNENSQEWYDLVSAFCKKIEK